MIIGYMSGDAIVKHTKVHGRTAHAQTTRVMLGVINYDDVQHQLTTTSQLIEKTISMYIKVCTFHKCLPSTNVLLFQQGF